MNYPAFYTKNGYAWAVVISPEKYIEVSTLNTSRQVLFGPSEVYVRAIVGTYQTCSREMFMRNFSCRFSDLIGLLIPFLPETNYEEVQQDLKMLSHAH